MRKHQEESHENPPIRLMKHLRFAPRTKKGTSGKTDEIQMKFKAIVPILIS